MGDRPSAGRGVTGYSDVPVVERMARAICLGYIRDEMISGHQEHVDACWQEWADIAREVLTALSSSPARL